MALNKLDELIIRKVCGKIVDLKTFKSFTYKYQIDVGTHDTYLHVPTHLCHAKDRGKPYLVLLSRVCLY